MACQHSLSQSLLVVLLLLDYPSIVLSSAPHIVIFLADDLGWNDVSFHGSEVRTPVIDEYARTGVRLQQYYVQPMCTPSRAALLSGRYPIHLGLQHEVIYAGQRAGLPLEVETLAQKLKNTGYATHGIGKWHLGFFKEEYLPKQRGFDSFKGYLGGNEDYYTKDHCTTLGCGYDFIDGNDIDTSDNGTYSTHSFTRRAHDIIINHNKEQPLFLYIPYQAVHFPLQVPNSYIDQYDFIVNQKRRVFAGMASCMDESIGNITGFLKDADMWNNTIMIFSTDNGGTPASMGNNFPLRGVKWTLWEGGIRGVAFVHSPLFPPERIGVEHVELMHISDWYPTILEGILGGKAIPGLDGVNMWPSIFQGVAGRRTEILHNIDPLMGHPGVPYFNNTFPSNTTAAIRQGDWKLITGAPGDGKWYPPPFLTLPNKLQYKLNPYLESGVQRFHLDLPAKNVWLFNITHDPEELDDVSERNPEVVRKLLDRLSVYNRTAVTPNFPPIDPAASPKVNGGFWKPWVTSVFAWNFMAYFVNMWNIPKYLMSVCSVQAI